MSAKCNREQKFRTVQSLHIVLQQCSYEWKGGFILWAACWCRCVSSRLVCRRVCRKDGVVVLYECMLAGTHGTVRFCWRRQMFERGVKLSIFVNLERPSLNHLPSFFPLTTIFSAPLPHIVALQRYFKKHEMLLKFVLKNGDIECKARSYITKL